MLAEISLAARDTSGRAAIGNFRRSCPSHMPTGPPAMRSHSPAWGFPNATTQTDKSITTATYGNPHNSSSVINNILMAHRLCNGKQALASASHTQPPKFISAADSINNRGNSRKVCFTSFLMHVQRSPKLGLISLPRQPSERGKTATRQTTCTGANVKGVHYCWLFLFLYCYYTRISYYISAKNRLPIL